MPRSLSTAVVAGVLGLMLSRADAVADERTAEGQPHKWQAVERGLYDFIAAGFELKSVVYDTAETAAKAEPDVHYFLQKGTQLVRCDFRQRDQTSYYWCYRLTKPGVK